MKINKLLIFTLLVAAASGCNLVTKKMPTVLEPQLSIAGMDSVEFNDEFVGKYANRLSADTRVDIVGAPEEGWAFRIDSIPRENGAYSLIVSDFSPYEDVFNRVWMVNLSAENKYIDHRLIYYRERFDERRTLVYSKIYLPEKKLVIFDKGNNIFDEFQEIPVIIRRNGMFEELPDVPFSKSDIALSGCFSIELSGKFPLKQQWTAVSFSENEHEIRTIETLRNGLGYFGHECTHTDLPTDQSFTFEVAFKGDYLKNDEIEILKEEEEENEEIAELIKQNLPKELDSLQYEFKNIKLFPLVVNEQTFWTAYYMYDLKIIGDEANEDDDYTIDDVTTVLGVTPQKQVVLLVKHIYADGVHYLRLKDKLLLYVTDYHPEDEIDAVEYKIYRMGNGFEKIFDEWGNYCD